MSMILKNRAYVRRQPSLTDKKIYIFCEGKKREYQYFTAMSRFESRVQLVVHKLKGNEDNSPAGLMSIAVDAIFGTEENPIQKNTFSESDEVWIVFDTDVDEANSRVPHILNVRNSCLERDRWYVAQSNPCFEVWLYYHFNEACPDEAANSTCKNWKNLVADNIPGGFNSFKHANRFEAAITNSLNNYRQDEDGHPEFGATQVHSLAQSINPLLDERLSLREGLDTAI